VTLQQMQEGYDEAGQPIEGWTDIATVWAGVEPLRGQEFMAAGAMGASLTTRIRIRYLQGVTPAMRVLYGTRAYNINAVIDPEERHREMQLMCTELL